MTHSSAVCAYGDSSYLERCPRSFAGQTAFPERLLYTMTSGPFPERLAVQYDFRYCTWDGEPGIGAGWNFALYQASGDFVTLAHQDDAYAEYHAGTLYRTAEVCPDLTFSMTDVYILRDGRIQSRSKAEFVKKLLRVSLRLPPLSTCAAGKRLSLRFGDSIVCPSCTHWRDVLDKTSLSILRRFVLGWELLWQLAATSGRWVVAEQSLLLCRIHNGAATVALTENHVREREEGVMFYRMWPEPVTESPVRVYRNIYVDYGA